MVQSGIAFWIARRFSKPSAEDRRDPVMRNPTWFDPLEFDGAWFDVVDRFRTDRLRAADDLRQKVAQSYALGDLLTPDIIAQGRSVLRTVDVRNQNPIFPPVFLTFLDNMDWVIPTDCVLQRFKQALGRTPKVYRGFVSNAAAQPIGGLFELNIFALLADAFPPAEPQPRVSGSRRRGDVRISIDHQPVFVECAVLGEGQFWTNKTELMRLQGVDVWSTSGPGPDHDRQRITRKVEEELAQLSPDMPNILCLSFFDWAPRSLARDWAFEDLFDPEKQVCNLEAIRRVDSIFEFDRSTFGRLRVNPLCGPTFRLSAAERTRLETLFRGTKPQRERAWKLSFVAPS